MFGTKTKDFWRGFFKEYREAVKRASCGVLFGIAALIIFKIISVPDEIYFYTIKIAVYLLILPFGILIIWHLTFKLFPCDVISLTQRNIIFILSVIPFMLGLLMITFSITNIKSMLFCIAVIAVFGTPAIYIDYRREKKRMTEYWERFSLYKSNISDDEKKINPVKDELFQIQREAFEKIKKIRDINPDNFIEKIEHAAGGRLFKNSEKSTFLFGDTESKLPKNCAQYIFNSDSVNISLLEFANAKSALRAFDRIPFSYVGIGCEPMGPHIGGMIFWSVKPSLENASLAAFVFSRYALCINVKTGLILSPETNNCSSEFMCDPENAEKILSSARKTLSVLSELYGSHDSRRDD